MNMKKSLAAVAAATVAVSAMATAISASVNMQYDSTIAGIPSYDSHSYTFNLVEQKATPNGLAVEAVTFVEDGEIKGIGATLADLAMKDADFSIEFVGKATDAVDGNGTAITDTPTIKEVNVNHTYTTKSDATVGYDSLLKANFKTTTWMPSFVVDGYETFTGSITIKYTSEKTIVSEFNAATGGNALFGIDLDGSTAADGTLATLTATSVKDGGKSIKNFPFFSADHAVNSGSKDTVDNNVYDYVKYDVIERIINVGAGINDYNQKAPYAAVAINDLLANYNDVTVTFKTATDGVDTNAGTNETAPYKQSWQNMWDAGIVDYTVFGQNMYGMWGDDATGFYGIPGFNWTNSNLFSAALVVNGDLTMAYNDVVAMEYGKKEITFNLTDILNASGYGQAGAPGYGSSMYTGYVRTMQLMTTTDWYWDSVTFNGTQIAAAGDAGAGEGMEDAGDSLEETPVETTVAEIIVAPEETTAAPAVEALPETGSAPIALAVIPVAVAAAAIVAKKRK